MWTYTLPNGSTVEVAVDPTVVPEGYDDATVLARSQETIPGMGSKPTGYARAASYLLAVPAFARPAVVDEARVQANMTGMRYADAVQVRSRDWWRCVAPGARETLTSLARG